MNEDWHEIVRHLLRAHAAGCGPGCHAPGSAALTRNFEVILDQAVSDILLADGRRHILIGISVNSDDGLLREITLLSNSADDASTLPMTHRADHPVAPIRQAISAADGCDLYRHSIPGR
jgi:hypothetical protein